MLGTRDYVREERLHRRARSALSGGIDSSLVAAIAADALGPEHVIGVLMPSRYSSEGSVTDAEALAANLGIAHDDGPDRGGARRVPRHAAPSRSRAPNPGLAEENLQARIRGTILMAMSNKFGWLVLTTGNKSEMATGLLDALRRHGRRLRGHQGRPEDARVRARARSQRARAAARSSPTSVLEKPPSAELRPDQKDSDSLPEYEVLDPIIEGYVEDDLSIAELEAAGLRRRHGAPGRAARRPQRVQAPPGAARASGCRPRRSARTGGCRSPTAGPARPLVPPMRPQRRFAAEAALVLAALLYGITFPLVHDALEDITPFAYLVGRFGIAVLVVRAVRRASRCARHGRIAALLVRAGVIAGVLLFGGYATQTVGLQYTSPSTSAFITGPVRRAHAGDRGRRVPARSARARCWAGIVLATVGLYLLTGADVHLGRGRAPHAGVRGAVRRSTSCTSARTRDRLPPAAVHRHAARRWSRCSRVPARRRAGRRHASPRSRCSRWCSPASRARRSRCRCSCGANAASRRPRAALILLAEPVFAGIAGYVNGERLGARRLAGARRHPGGHRGVGVLAAAARCPPDECRR